MSRFFYEQKEQYPCLMQGVGFRERGLSVESEEVDQAYSNLTATGLLSSHGVRFNPHEFSPECREYFEKRLKRHFSKQDLKELKEMSKKFQEEFSIDDVVSSRSVLRKVC